MRRLRALARLLPAQWAWVAVGGVAVGAALLLGVYALSPHGPVPSAAQPQGQGASIFQTGTDAGRPVSARLASQPDELPSMAVRCINCHDRSGARQARRAPVLDPAGLTQPMPRRGGPPSAFDRDTFCRLLRTGVDPAWVVVDVSMPRYALSDEQCHALWTHLLEGAQ